MKLVQEIQTAAVDASSEVSVLLRKCLVLASRIELQELQLWAEYELNGYPDEVELAPYRVIAADSMGRFVSGTRFTGIAQFTAPIPLSSIPEEFREKFRYIHLRKPISDLEEMIRVARTQTEGGSLMSPWPGDIVQRFAQDIFEDTACLQAWWPVTQGQLRGVVESVRNRVLSFVLRLQADVPSLKADEVPTPGDLRGAQQIFNTTIMGSVSEWNTAGGNINQATTNIKVEAGSWEQLSDALTRAGILDEDLQELRVAMEQDGGAVEGSFGERVGDWLGRMMGKAASGSWDLSVAAAGQLLGAALSRYYGLG